MYSLTKNTLIALIIALTKLLLVVEPANTQRPIDYPTRMSSLVKYNLFKVTRVASRSFSDLPQTRREKILKDAQSSAIEGCNQMTNKYQELAKTDIGILPSNWDYKYLHEYRFEHVQNLNGSKVSPVFKGFTEEKVYMAGDRKMFKISAVFYCYGRWVDLNQGRFN